MPLEKVSKFDLGNLDQYILPAILSSLLGHQRSIGDRDSLRYIRLAIFTTECECAPTHACMNAISELSLQSLRHMVQSGGRGCHLKVQVSDMSLKSISFFLYDHVVTAFCVNETAWVTSRRYVMLNHLAKKHELRTWSKLS
jgi:hypothetical protein